MPALRSPFSLTSSEDKKPKTPSYKQSEIGVSEFATCSSYSVIHSDHNELSRKAREQVRRISPAISLAITSSVDVDKHGKILSLERGIDIQEETVLACALDYTEHGTSWVGLEACRSNAVG